jgi:hypothetical protein
VLKQEGRVFVELVRRVGLMGVKWLRFRVGFRLVGRGV